MRFRAPDFSDLAGSAPPLSNREDGSREWPGASPAAPAMPKAACAIAYLPTAMYRSKTHFLSSGSSGVRRCSSQHCTVQGGVLSW